ncbi:ribonuclease HI [bacterium]|nr:ribonuclease HI [bacterium]
MTQPIEIWTDGACSGNPGPGGWGAIVRRDGEDRELFGGEPATTNNRMELLAAIMALESVPEGARVILHTDSVYVKDGLTKWILGWKRNGWRTADRKPVKNQDLWVRLDRAAASRRVDWRWVKGHAGDPGNERADALARKGCEDHSGSSRKA